jgi:cytochrome c556
MALKTTMALALAAGLACGAALAQDAAGTPGGKAVLARQAHMKELNKAFGGIGAELRKDAPDKAVIAAGAPTVAGLAKQVPSWFPKGSGPEAGVKTAAKAEIWTDAAGFAAAATKLADETAKLQQVATGGDIDAFKTQFRAVAGACKSCHDTYRAPAEPH